MLKNRLFSIVMTGALVVGALAVVATPAFAKEAQPVIVNEERETRNALSTPLPILIKKADAIKTALVLYPGATVKEVSIWYTGEKGNMPFYMIGMENGYSVEINARTGKYMDTDYDVQYYFSVKHAEDIALDRFPGRKVLSVGQTWRMGTLIYIVRLSGDIRVVIDAHTGIILAIKS